MIESRQIILANGPRLLRSMLRRVLDKMPALEVAGEVDDLAMLPSLIDQRKVYWIFVSLSAQGSIPEGARSLLQRHPSVGIVGIAEDGSLVKIRGVGHVETTTSALSLDQLVATLRQQPVPSTGGV